MTASAPAFATPPLLCAVLPAYKARDHIGGVLTRIPEEIGLIIVVDDACPVHTGDFVEQNFDDPRLVVVRLEENQGVGGAVLAGFKTGLEHGADILIKIDSDGQMDPLLAPQFAEPILQGDADYVKGNRFFYMDASETMPIARRIGNLGLTFISRFSTGYFSASDPTNGYPAISAPLAQNLPAHKIAKRYFFETDLLFRINTLGARVLEVPHKAFYGDEESGLDARKEFLNFLRRNVSTYFKRLFYQYALRDFNVGSLFLLAGLVCGFFGVGGALIAWFQSTMTGIPRSGGALAMVEVLIILAAIFLVGFLNFDISREPRTAISSRLKHRAARPLPQFEKPNDDA